MIWLFLAALAWGGDTCKQIGVSNIAAVPSPGIVVLGERRGALTDLYRARKVLRRLLKNPDTKVTLALDAIHHRYQRDVDDYAAGKLTIQEFEQRVDWSNQSAASFAPYGRLLQLAHFGLEIEAVGSDLVGRPADVTPPVPAAYPPMVSSVIPDGELAFGLDGRIAETIAYWDYQVAMRALNEWDGTGHLVVLTERARVEGGGGVPWQLMQASDRPVYAFLLAWAEPYCEDGDNVWAQYPILHSTGLVR